MTDVDYGDEATKEALRLSIALDTLRNETLSSDKCVYDVNIEVLNKNIDKARLLLSTPITGFVALEYLSRLILAYTLRSENQQGKDTIILDGLQQLLDCVSYLLDDERQLTPPSSEWHKAVFDWATKLYSEIFRQFVNAQIFLRLSPHAQEEKIINLESNEAVVTLLDIIRLTIMHLKEVDCVCCVDTLLRNLRDTRFQHQLMSTIVPVISDERICKILLQRSVLAFRESVATFESVNTTNKMQLFSQAQDRFNSLLKTLADLLVNILHRESVSTQYGESNPARAAITEALLAGLKQPNEDNLNIAVLFKLLIVSPYFMNTIVQQAAPFVNDKNINHIACAIEKQRNLVLPSTTSLDIMIEKMASDMTPETACVIFIPMFELAYNAWSESSQYAAPTKKSARNILNNLLNVTMECVNDADFQSNNVSLKKVGMQLLYQVLQQRRQYFIDHALSEKTGSSEEALLSKKFIVNILCLIGLHEGERGAVDIVTRFLFAMQNDEQRFLALLLIQNLRPYSTDLTGQLVSQLRNESILSRYLNELEVHYNITKRKLLTDLFDNLTRLVEWERENSRQIDSHISKAFDFLRLNEAIGQNFIPVLDIIVIALGERTNEEQQLSATVLIFAKSILPSIKDRVNSANLLSALRKLTRFIWRFAIDDFCNVYLLISLVDVINALIERVIELEHTPIIYDIIFRDLLKMVFEEGIPVVQASSSRPDTEITTLWDDFKKRMRDELEKLRNTAVEDDDELSSKPTHFTVNARQFVHTGSLRKTKPLHYERQELESEPVLTFMYRQRLTLALLSLAGVFTPETIDSKRVELLCDQIKMSLAGDNPTALRINWHSSNIECQIALNQYVAVVNQAYRHRMLIFDILDTVSQVCALAVRQVALMLARSTLVVAIERHLQLTGSESDDLTLRSLELSDRINRLLYRIDVVPRPIALAQQLITLLPKRRIADVLMDVYDFLMTYTQQNFLATKESKNKFEQAPFDVNVTLRRTWHACMAHIVTIPPKMIVDVFGESFNV